MKKLLYLLAGLLCVAMTFSCTDSAKDTDVQIASANEAISAGNYDQAQTILDKISSAGTSSMSENSLGQLSVEYMRLSEHINPEENVANAASCYREAARLSADSLRSFSATLQPEDLAHFYLVKRIVAGIDNPVDLTADEFTAEDSIGTDDLLGNQQPENQ